MAGDVGDCRIVNEEGAAGCGNFHIGIGGFCADLDPPVGYWCSKNPPRGQAYNHTTRDTCGGPHHDCGGTQIHMSPAGLVYSNGSVLPHAPHYRNASGAMVQAWRGGQAWYTNGCLVESHDRATGSLYFDPKVGCNQGGEGMVSGGEWWIVSRHPFTLPVCPPARLPACPPACLPACRAPSPRFAAPSLDLTCPGAAGFVIQENVLEELDAPREWFYNSMSRL